MRVLEVVPAELRIALAALAGLGLLLAAATAVQTVRRRRLARQRGLLLADVGVLQSALLPQLPERIGGARVSAAYRPADGLAAGGDFYDAFELPGGRTGVLVGDVAGHGREVVPLTALVRYNVRAYLEAGLPPRAAVHVAANVLVPHLGDLQVTIVVAIFDPGTGRLTYACAGHAPPLLLGSTTAPITACSSPPIGAGAPTGRRQTTVAFAPGAVACLHTDGLDEAPLTYGRLGRDGVGEELAALGAQRDAGELIARVVRRSRRQTDDMAACVVTALPGGADGWSLRLEELEVDTMTLSSGWAQRFLNACGVENARTARALREAHAIIARDGTAVIEVRVGDTLADVRVTPPPAVTLPIAARAAAPVGVAAATG
ncbi:MAG: PP2C family protein-serine/threonine phosphatase [Solirubrobacteraceae bacterium]|nr:PP2C family protein-serine/threonine phosphatase [Solirubrobacteraceae bacterium]